jgi:hypothetical protein
MGGGGGGQGEEEDEVGNGGRLKSRTAMMHIHKLGCGCGCGLCRNGSHGRPVPRAPWWVDNSEKACEEEGEGRNVSEGVREACKRVTSPMAVLCDKEPSAAAAHHVSFLVP